MIRRIPGSFSPCRNLAAVARNGFVKCNSCGGRLEGAMNFCAFCGVRQEIDLRQVHFRDLGANLSMPCPCCEGTTLGVIEFDLEPKVSIERCQTCYGMFFNPGELEYLLEARIHPTVWLDIEGLNQIAADFGHDNEVRYRKCPMCAEWMSRVNFGGRSGVILDQCGTHGVWLDGGELRRLTEWWRAGGKLLYQQHQEQRTKLLYKSPVPEKPKAGSIESPDGTEDNTWGNPGGPLSASWTVLSAVGWILASLLD